MDGVLFLSLQKRPDGILHPPGIFRHISEPADGHPRFGVEDTFLSPFAADGKAVRLHPDIIAVAALAVWNLPGNGLLYPAFR